MNSTRAILTVTVFSVAGCHAPEPVNPPVDWATLQTLRSIDGATEYDAEQGESLEKICAVGDRGAIVFFDGSRRRVFQRNRVPGTAIGCRTVDQACNESRAC